MGKVLPSVYFSYPSTAAKFFFNAVNLCNNYSTFLPISTVLNYKFLPLPCQAARLSNLSAPLTVFSVDLCKSSEQEPSHSLNVIFS